jgi:serine/threonine protein kinase
MIASPLRSGLMRLRVAAKWPHAWLGARLHERFHQERQILASLTHPNIARRFDVGLTARSRLKDSWRNLQVEMSAS